MSARLEKLRELGATNVGGKSGVIPVRGGGSRKVLSYEVFDTTPIWRLARPYVIPLALRRIQLSRELRGSGKKSCVSYIDPKILVQMLPVKVRNIAFHVWSLKLAGDIINELKNDGEEGQEGTTTVKKRQSCPTDPGAYSWKTVAGSADLSSRWLHDFVDDETGTALDSVPGDTFAARASAPQVSAVWETGGIGDLIWQILRILARGSISTRNGFDVSATYQWQGSSRTVDRHIDARVILPVEGNITWEWN